MPALLAASIFAICCPPAASGSSSSAPSRILFIGNSQVATHEIQDLVAALRRSATGTVPAVERITRGGETFERHVERRDAGAPLKRIAEGDWDLVVLQANGTLAATRRPQGLEPFSVRPGRRLAEEARRAGARVLLYQTWPARGRPADLDNIRWTYERLSDELEAPIAPAGEAFDRARSLNPPIPEDELYQDRVHAGLVGAYLAACVLYAALYDESPVGLEPLLGLDPNVAHRMQDLAWSTWRTSSGR